MTLGLGVPWQGSQHAAYSPGPLRSTPLHEEETERDAERACEALGHPLCLPAPHAPRGSLPLSWCHCEDKGWARAVSCPPGKRPAPLSPWVVPRGAVGAESWGGRAVVGTGRSCKASSSAWAGRDVQSLAHSRALSHCPTSPGCHSPLVWGRDAHPLHWGRGWDASN